uniref:Protein kinase domain-containing protein n=1 Tax=Oryza glumipatula TaxID=40148 RepID=A0A0E0BMN5_9ORYZ
MSWTLTSYDYDDSWEDDASLHGNTFLEVIGTEMEPWAIRVAYFIVFSFLVTARFGSCAPHSEEGRALPGYRESEQDQSIGSLSNWGEGKLIGRVFNLLLKENMFASETPSESKEHSSISESVPHDKLFTVPHQGDFCKPGSWLLIKHKHTPKANHLQFNHQHHTWAEWTAKEGICVPSLERTELEAACEGFINVIGTLPECTLYKGTLSSGVEIAVLSTSVNSSQQWSAQSEEQFRNKISVLSRVNHKNFMNLIGYCACEEPFTRMMVFEYAPCGSLFEHLHIREAEHLDWKTRLRIIMGVAYCLEHMSQLDPPPLLPTNLSSSSIYLTEDNAAKIADIEFWKDDINKQDDQESVVYKFGILVLEVISGRRPFSEDDRLLVLWASSYLDGKRPLSAMADRTLVRSSSAAPEKDVAALCDVVRQCVRRPEAGKRAISMGEVARLVRGIAGLSPEQAAPREKPLWWAELEIASSETA